MRIAEAKLVEVVLKVLRRNGVVGPVQAPLELTPKAVDGLRVDRAPDILPGTVLHALMDEARRLGAVVDVALVRGEHRARHDVGRQERHDRRRPGVRDGLRLDGPAALDHAEHGRLALGSDSALTARTLAADVGLVGLNAPAQDAAFIGHEKPNLAGHAPRALVGHAQLAFKLLRRHAVLGRGEQEDGVEPGQQRRRALVEDRVRRRADLVAAPGARAGLAAPARIKALGLAAPVARRPVLAVARDEQKPQTGRVVGELRLEVLDGVFHLTPNDDRTASITSQWWAYPFFANRTFAAAPSLNNSEAFAKFLPHLYIHIVNISELLGQARHLLKLITSNRVGFLRSAKFYFKLCDAIFKNIYLKSGIVFFHIYILPGVLLDVKG